VPPLAAVDDDEEDEVEEDEEDLDPSLEPRSPFELDGVDFWSDGPEDSEPDEDAEDLAAFRLSVL
jgi:hypothetical protein